MTKRETYPPLCITTMTETIARNRDCFVPTEHISLCRTAVNKFPLRFAQVLLNIRKGQASFGPELTGACYCGKDNDNQALEKTARTV